MVVLGLVNRSDLNGAVGEVLQAVQLHNAATQKLGDGRVDVMMSSSKGKAKENVRIKPENLRLYARKLAVDRAVHPGIRCVIKLHSRYHDRRVVEVVSYDPRNESVAVRSVSRNPDEPTFFVMAHNVVPLCLHLLARRTFAAVLKLLPELRQLDTDLGAAVVTCLKSCGLFFARCCRPDVTTSMIKLALQNFYVSYVFESHALTKARKYDWYFEYALIAVNVVTGYMEQHEYHEQAYEVHSLCKITFEERNVQSMNVAMSFMNIGVMCNRMNRLEEAESNLLQAQKFLHERGFYETNEASKVMWSLGVCYSMQKSKWELGEKLLKDSMRMKLKRAGRGALEVTVPLDSLIVLYLKQNRLKEAEILCKEMLRLRESLLSPHTAQYSEALFRIAQLYERRNLLVESECVCKEVLKLRDAFFGWESLAVAEVLLLLALLRARAMRLDESELLLKEVLRIAPLLNSSGVSCSSSGGGVPGIEVHAAVALFAHICMIRGNTDQAIALHAEALELNLKLGHSSGQPAQPCSSNLANVWLQSSPAASDVSTAPLEGESSAGRSSVWTASGLFGSVSDTVHAMLFSLPDSCAPEVLAKWVVHSDLLEAKGHAKRRVYEPENSAAAAWIAAVEQEMEPKEPVAENVIEFFIDRAVERGQLVWIPDKEQADAAVPFPNDAQPPQLKSTPDTSVHPECDECHARCSHGAAVPNSIYQDCLSTGSGEFINLYANVLEHDTGAPPLSMFPAAPMQPQSVDAPPAQLLPDKGVNALPPG